MFDEEAIDEEEKVKGAGRDEAKAINGVFGDDDFSPSPVFEEIRIIFGTVRKDALDGRVSGMGEEAG